MLSRVLQFLRTPVVALSLIALSAQGGQAFAKGGAVRAGLAEVNGTKLYYEVAGKGCPIVLIGIGAGVDSRLWDDQFRDFAKHYKVIRYDIRGFGKSASPTGPYSHVDDLHALLGFLKVKRTYVMGLSAGGGIAIDFTLRHPQMVIGLITVGGVVSGYQFSEQFRRRDAANIEPALRGDYEKMAENMLNDPYTIPARGNPSVRVRYKALLLDQNNTRRFRMEYPAPLPLEPPAIGRLSEIHAPTLIITGSLDIADVLNITEILRAGISGSVIVSILGGGHLVNMEKPEVFNKVVLDFLKR